MSSIINKGASARPVRVIAAFVGRNQERAFNATLVFLWFMAFIMPAWLIIHGIMEPQTPFFPLDYSHDESAALPGSTRWNWFYIVSGTIGLALHVWMTIRFSVVSMPLFERAKVTATQAHLTAKSAWGKLHRREAYDKPPLHQARDKPQTRRTKAKLGRVTLEVNADVWCRLRTYQQSQDLASLEAAIVQLLDINKVEECKKGP